MKVLVDRYTMPLSIGKILAGLKAQGYKLKFRRETTCLYCIELDWWIMPDSFTVDEYYYFEDSSNPDGDRIVYAISSVHGIKGFLVDTCMVYEDNISPEMILKLEYSTTQENIHSIKKNKEYEKL